MRQFLLAATARMFRIGGSFGRKGICPGFRIGLLRLVCLCAAMVLGLPAHAAADLGRTVTVPFDHAAPARGGAPLYYELGAPFEPSKPTIFIVADAQQFYVRRGQIASLQNALFGGAFNVVGIVGRGATPEFIRHAQDAHGKPDWLAAWNVFNSNQWIEDIDTVRRDLLGADGKVMLYGRSGGAFLVHQYLARHGEHVTRAFTQAPLNPFLIRELRLNSDHFWEQLTETDRALLKKALASRPQERETILRTLQRQNFFHDPAKLPAARSALIEALAEGNAAAYAAARRDYQVDAIDRLMDSPAGIAIAVRMFEFFQPSGASERLGGEAVCPDLENQYNLAHPLVSLFEAGKIPMPTFDFDKLHRLDTEVFLLAGRFDHTADYRSVIALAAHYPHQTLFMAADNHAFGDLDKAGVTVRLQRTFFAQGGGSKALHEVMRDAGSLWWRE